MLTSNKGIGEWGELPGDTVNASAILDRPLHNSSMLHIQGAGCRPRWKRQAGLFISHQLLGTKKESANDNYPH